MGLSLSPFDRAFGIVRPQGAASGELALPLVEAHTNWYGAGYGGCAMALGLASMQELVGPDAAAVTYHTQYISGIAVGQTLHAQAELVRDGRSCAFAKTLMTCGDKVISTGDATFMHPSSHAPMPSFGTPCDPGEPVAILCEPGGGHCPDEDCAPGELARHLVRRDKADPDFYLPLKGKVCVGLQTSNLFKGANGKVSAAALPCLADLALGLANISLGTPAVTLDLTVYASLDVEPGALILCSVETTCAQDRFMVANGTFWADGQVIGSCSSAFFRNPAMVLSPAKERA